jgi:DNA-binding transcriptional MerR regulator
VGVYSIKELEVMTGIKAHTIRIWEQRYNILNPNRTDTNIRFYTEEDMKHLLNIALLNRNGYKISRIASMSPAQLRERVLQLSENNFEQGNLISAMVMAMLTYDENSFEKIITTNILRSGFEQAFFNLVFSFLNRIGILWQTGVIRPAQEHFMSHLIRQKIISATESHTPDPAEGSAKFMLFLPEREMHELPLLFMNYTLRKRRQHTLYLGAAVPTEDVFACYNDYKPDFIITTCISHPNNGNVQTFINSLSEYCANSLIYISGTQALECGAVLPRNMRLLNNIESGVHMIEKILALESTAAY